MSDRELDALVAQHVMGWTRVSPSLEEGASPKYSVRRRYPHYSTSIADAWLVVEKMRGQEFYFGLLDPSRGRPFWECEFHGHNSSLIPGEGFVAYADTAPRAICLAALKAVGVEVTA